MISLISKITDDFIAGMNQKQKELDLLKKKMTKEQLKMLNSFQAEIESAKKSNDIAKIMEITKKYFSENGNTK
jgi:hypothetical protein